MTGESTDPAESSSPDPDVFGSADDYLFRSGRRLALAALLLLGAVFFFYRLGSVPLIGPDEPRYAQVAREMLDREDLVTPTLGGKPWFEKPVLLYWLMMIGMGVLGVTEWAARLPSAIIAMLTIFGVQYTASRLVSARFGFVSAVILLVNVMFPSFAHGASTDMPVSGMITLALCCFLLFEASADGRGGHWMLAAYAFSGLAVLAKGVIGIILPGSIIGLYLLLTGRLGRLRHMRVIKGLIVFTVIAATWYAPVMSKHGWAFVDEFFLSHHLQRFTTGRFHHPGPFYYYLPVILAGTFPWTVYLISAFTQFRWPARTSEEPRVRLQWFCGIWVLLPVIFFSFSGSKLPGYILPAVPGAALLIAGDLDRFMIHGSEGRGGRSLVLTSLLILAVAVAGVILARAELELPMSSCVLILMTAVMTAGIMVVFCLKDQVRLALVGLISGCALCFTLINYLVLPTVAQRESLAPLAQTILHALKPGQSFVAYYTYHHSLTFYTNARTLYDEKGNVVILNSHEELFDKVRTDGQLLCLTQNRVLSDLVRDLRLQAEPVGRQGDYVAVRLSPAGGSP